ncbi:MAG: two-component system, sensor histidine kinase YesM, partial [Clostridiales bacterium]|nr:two-component system, sensor histidine kinase YesM [Clostridiales bacterium]
MIRNLKSKVYAMSLKYKIAWISLVTALVPLFIFALVIIHRYNQATVTRSKNHIEENLSVMTDRIENVFSNAEVCSNYITINMNRILEDNEKNEVTIEGLILGELNSALVVFGDMESIVYLDKSGKLYNTNTKATFTASDLLSSKGMKTLEQTTGKTILFDKGDSFGDIVLGKKVLQKESGKLLGYLFIQLPTMVVEKNFDNKISQYYLFDRRGINVTERQEITPVEDKVLSEGLWKQEESKTFSFQGNSYLVASVTSEVYGWTVVGITNLDAFNVEIKDIVYTMVGIGFVLVFLLTLVVILITGFITKPLVILKEGAEQIGNGDLAVKFYFKTEDEIGKLGQIFNRMTSQIEELLRKVDEEARKKREYELSLIGEQVKPHFLYNTLDIIIMLSQMNKNREAQRVTKKLADYYKNSLSDSEEIIPLERELRIIEDYLELQMMRYEDKFTYDISVDLGCNQVSVPKMTLQPIVENAIYHGLKYKKDWGTIAITCRLLEAEQQVEIVIRDNGIGMEPERLEQLILGKDNP